MKLYEARVSVQGVKKRCRKVSREVFRFARVPFENADRELENLIARAKAKRDEQMKSWQSSRLCLDVIRVENGIEYWEPFNQENITMEID